MARRFIVQLREDQYVWLQRQASALRPMSAVLRDALDAAMQASRSTELPLH
jgi:hypothetical protein